MKITPSWVRGELIQRGFDRGFNGWAKQHGYSRQHVSSVVHRWCGRTSGVPKGGAYRIVLGISKTIGQPITLVVPFFES